MSEGIYVIKRNPIIKIRTRSVIQLTPVITPYTFTATEGQTEFTLDTTPASIALLSINGVMQNLAAGDFSLSGNVITLKNGVHAGAMVFGIYAEQYTPIINDIYFVATQGQSVFLMETAPRAIFALAINGVIQNGLAGDYTIVGKTLTFSTALDAGDKVTGAYQK